MLLQQRRTSMHLGTSQKMQFLLQKAHPFYLRATGRHWICLTHGMVMTDRTVVTITIVEHAIMQRA